MTLLMRDNEMKRQGREEGLIAGLTKGRNMERIESIRNMLKYVVPKEMILEDYTEEEFALATHDPKETNES